VIWRLVFRSDAPQSVERFGSGIGELKGAATLLKASAAARSLEFDLLYTQYDDLLVSRRAAQAFMDAGLTGFVCDDRVAVYVSKAEAPARYLALRPRGFAGLVHPDSGVRVARFSKGQATFALPANPRWRSDARLYAAAGDVLLLWPFHNELFVSDRFREVVQKEQLAGFEFMPFDATEPKAGSGWRGSSYRRVSLAAPPAWLAGWQKAALWRQMQVCAAPGVLPGQPPADWGLDEDSAIPASAPVPAAPLLPALDWQRRTLAGPLPAGLEARALDYLRDELATPAAQDWTPQSLAWDGDALRDGVAFRRWRLQDHPTPLWAVYQAGGADAGFSVLEDETGGSMAPSPP
jgi:hypothetical protein